ncbi:mediator of RNA polymerase II transcription subunit 27-like [Saccoglossus kowalevskii]|uniref:Mediator of RNA polymerase II transcription subunit 27-like n=1 Tax=Saccoglossus kowalevskii TaxID=10224 RepID=A0ABM0GMB1_SACKO|nr:PREDICTED: mediator of RNA polymerase II transcription subunit 27-like [Saccoglossus kowalevskii]
MAENLETVNSALAATQKLRCSVTRVFTHLREGVKSTKGEVSKESMFIRQLQEALTAVTSDFSELEKLSSSLHKFTDGIPMGNSGLLSLDPVQDKTPMYTQLLQSYKWSTKLQSHASLAGAMLTQNSLKRTSVPSGGLSAKRRKTQPTCHATPAHLVDNVVTTVDRSFNDLSLTVNRPQGTGAVLQATVGRTLSAIVILRGLLIERVIVRGYHENLHKDNGTLDLWTPSKYRVFQKLTDHAMAAMLHYHLPHLPEIGIRSFMTWLHSYTTLFSTACHRCGKYLNGNIPPTWRDFRTLEVCHENCRQ